MGWLIFAALVAALLVFAWSYDRRQRRAGSDHRGISPSELGTRVTGGDVFRQGREVPQALMLQRRCLPRHTARS